MDKFEVKKTETKDLPTMIAEACKELEIDMKPDHIKLSGKFDSGQNMLIISGKAFDSDEIHEKVESIFFSIFSYLPMDIRGKRYRLELTIYSDIMFKREKHSYYIETSLDKMPDSGGVTRKEWEEFTGQLIFRKDGRRMMLPAPLPFLEEPVQNKV
ncbi:MAG: hypothetical protein LWY06_10415 [Firmicutes bacterium]|nr:hypothetical protein [Bacillota bacterium]